jgi:hypothetical protein
MLKTSLIGIVFIMSLIGACDETPSETPSETSTETPCDRKTSSSIESSWTVIDCKIQDAWRHTATMAITMVMEVPGGIILRTIRRETLFEQIAVSESMLFVPNVSMDDFTPKTAKHGLSP